MIIFPWQFSILGVEVFNGVERWRDATPAILSVAVVQFDDMVWHAAGYVKSHLP